MSKKKEIFTNRGPLSENEINSYLDGSADESLKRSIEMKISESDLNADAIEGFESFGEALNEYDIIRQEINNRLKAKKKFWKFQYTLILAFVLCAGTMYIGSILFAPKAKKTTIPISEAPKKQKPDFMIKELSEAEIMESENLHPTSLITAEHVILESPIVVTENATNPTEKEIVAKRMELKKVLAIKSKKIDYDLQAHIKFIKTPTLFLNDLLVIDYGASYASREFNSLKPEEGTPAILENKTDQPNEAQIDDVQVKQLKYINVLSAAQLSFRNNNFKSALTDYKLILSNYPNDINAHFYSGLCYYNISQPEKALEHFMKVRSSEINTFHEEADWYRGQCHKIKGDEITYISILNEIVTKNGFYAKRAAVELAKI